ncbi:MAG TPA: error-prone DNA polymerase [Phycisphaerales bacterium]|nr:error-prone DNA polymerase [Phycisphaerales bacterium]
MPQNEFPKPHPHPFKQPPEAPAGMAHRPAPDRPAYAELCATSNYTFLTGASHPEEFVAQAAALGYRAIALTDTHTLAGIVRAHVAAKEVGIRLVIGSRLRPDDLSGCTVCVYPTAMESYRRLCRLLTVGKRRAPKGACRLGLDDLAEHGAGMLGIVVPLGEPGDEFGNAVQRLRAVFDDDRLSIAATMNRTQGDAERLDRLVRLSARSGVPLVASNDALYHRADRRMLQDVLTCIRHGCTLAQAGFRLDANAERHLKPAGEMHRLFAACPRAISRGLEIVERTGGWSLDELRYEYPDEVVPPGRTPQQHLTDLTWAGAEQRYGQAVPEKVRARIEHELRLIDELGYAPYFLTVHDLVRFARTGQERPGDPPVDGWTQPILCQGRGAAANSAVCFCLGVTSVDPARIDMLFERFVSRERNEPPDIDIDFEHERREEVIQYLYRKYGRERAALTAEVISYRRRSAVRDVGKALGLSLDLVDRLAKDIEWFDEGVVNPSRLRELGVNPEDPTVRWLVRLVDELRGFPRHLSQHVGGFVITRSPLCELVPIENAAMPDRTVIEWDKDDIEAAGMLKVDVLGLGMLTALRKAFDLVGRVHGARHTLATIPPEDPATYEMIRRADTVGVFQIESRAQMSMLPRLKPDNYYDLVIEVAIVRPGPIQGGMVHPYLRRRQGLEPVQTLPHDVPESVRRDVEQVLGKTLGVPLFQEQCMALAVKAAGFSPGKADQLRRAMAAWKRKGDQLHRFGRELVEGMLRNGLPMEFALRCFDQIKGFSSYGFPESHAASFALLVYASAWFKRHYPAEFCAALLNSQPMGFYAPAQLVRDAREHGVRVLPVDVNSSAWESTIQNGALRLGMHLVGGVGQADATRISGAAAAKGPFRSMPALWRASGARAVTLRRLAAADAFGSMGLTRQQALWQARLLRDEPLPLFGEAGDARGSNVAGSEEGLDLLPNVGPLRQVALDYGAVGLSLKAHPVSFARGRLDALGVTACADLRDAAKSPDGEVRSVAGLVLVRQRPGTANDVTFMTIEDETGIANLIVWRRTYQRFRREARAGLLVATGRVQRQGEVVHVVVTSMRDLDDAVDHLRAPSRNFH